MQPCCRVLLLAAALTLVLLASFLPIFITDLSSALTSRLSWLKYSHRYNVTNDYPKYFQEGQKGGVLRHYDGRFQHGILTDADRLDTQIHMMRAYLEFCREKGLETWLAHGTLLGWWWNAKILPWDNDIDVQLSLPTLTYLAAHHNQTIYDYSSSSGPPPNTHPPSQPPTEPIKRSYLLDINPAFLRRTKGNGDNIIDARWIDMRNGLYVDLTAVSETSPSRHPGLWTCKNEHRYRTKDLYPMRETLFEGVAAKVPYAYVRILSEEYQEKALVVTDFENHWWNATSLVWSKKSSEDMKHNRIEKENAARQKLEDKAREIAAKKKAKELKKAFKAKGGVGTVQEEPLGDEDGDGFDEFTEDYDAVEKEPTARRKARRAAVTEELVAEGKREEESARKAKRRRERQDVL